jgi:hypothetical protein
MQRRRRQNTTKTRIDECAEQQPWCRELTIRVLSRIGHAEASGAQMLANEIFVPVGTTVDALATGTVAALEVT